MYMYDKNDLQTHPVFAIFAIIYTKLYAEALPTVFVSLLSVSVQVSSAATLPTLFQTSAPITQVRSSLV